LSELPVNKDYLYAVNAAALVPVEAPENTPALVDA
jgi:hypothetical protein